MCNVFVVSVQMQQQQVVNVLVIYNFVYALRSNFIHIQSLTDIKTSLNILYIHKIYYNLFDT